MKRQLSLNITLLRNRRVDLRLSQAELSRAAGLTAGHLQQIEAGSGEGLLTLDQVTRLADTLHLDVLEILGQPPAPADVDDLVPEADDAATTADIRRLAGMLIARHEPLSRDTAARTLGWTLPRVVATLDALTDRLPAVGLELVLDGYDLMVRPLDTWRDVPAIAMQVRQSQVRRDLRPATMLALLRLLDDESTDDIPEMDLVRGELLAAGLVDEIEGELLVTREVENALLRR